ncbi:MAG: FecR domain-containing protein [Planctomycetota bacterium]
MTRAEELILKKADLGLDPAEEAELAGLLADPGTAERCLALVDVEAELRAARIDDALPDVVVAAALGRRDALLEAAVMDRVRRSAPVWLPRTRKRSFVFGAVAAGTLLAAGLALLRPLPPAAIGHVGDVSPGASIERGGRAKPAVPSDLLRPGDELRSTSGSVEFVIDGVAQVRMEPDSVLALEGARRIVLRQGELELEVQPQRPGWPLVIEAPHARAEVLGTRLKLSAAGDATRLEVRTGSVRLVRAQDGAGVVVREKQFSIAGEDVDLSVRPLPPRSEEIPEVTGFSLITLDAPRNPIPGYEDLQDGAIIDLSKLPTRRMNLRANTRPANVGSVRFSTDRCGNVNTELTAPYTIVPGNGIRGRIWNPAPGRHTVTATPYTGTYGNGERGRPRTLVFTVVD